MLDVLAEEDAFCVIGEDLRGSRWFEAALFEPFFAKSAYESGLDIEAIFRLVLGAQALRSESRGFYFV